MLPQLSLNSLISRRSRHSYQKVAEMGELSFTLHHPLTLHHPRPSVCCQEAIKQSTTFVDALGHMGGPGDGFGRRRSSGHVRAAAETPAAVSAADAAGAGPELGCAGQLERAAEAPIDEASSLCVGSVGRSVGRSVGSGRDLYLVYPGLVAFAGVRPPRRVLSNHGTGFFGRLVSSSRL